MATLADGIGLGRLYADLRVSGVGGIMTDSKYNNTRGVMIALVVLIIVFLVAYLFRP